MISVKNIKAINHKMQIMKQFFIALLSALILLPACKNKSTSASEIKQSTEAAVKKGKYAIKSGVVEYKTQIMGMDAKQILMFDEYGEKEKTEIEIEMMGVKSHTCTITKDGFVYTFDPEKKTGTKTSLIPQSTNIDFENLTEEFKEDMKLVKLGSETFLEKKCDKYSIDNEKLKMKGTYLVWKGIPLKTDVDLSSMKMALAATKVDENTGLPASTFDIPTDIKFE